MSIQFGRFAWVKLKILGWLQRQCQHPDELVSTDISEGLAKIDISWCRICGATRIYGSIHEPRADWWIKENREAQHRLVLPFKNETDREASRRVDKENFELEQKIRADSAIGPSPQQLAECDCPMFDSSRSGTCIWPKCAEKIDYY